MIRTLAYLIEYHRKFNDWPNTAGLREIALEIDKPSVTTVITSLCRNGAVTREFAGAPCIVTDIGLKALKQHGEAAFVLIGYPVSEAVTETV